MTTPFKVKLTIYQGSTFRWHAVLKNGTPAVATNLTGYTARLQMRSEIGSSNVLANLTTSNGGITLGGALGTIDLYMSSADTSLINWEDGVYDMEFVAPNGDVIRRMYGTVVVSPEVTR